MGCKDIGVRKLAFVANPLLKSIFDDSDRENLVYIVGINQKCKKIPNRCLQFNLFQFVGNPVCAEAFTGGGGGAEPASGAVNWGFQAPTISGKKNF